MAKPDITQNRLHALVYFDEACHTLRWRVFRKPKLHPGDQMGWVGKDGYRRAIIDGKNYLLHRLIWLYHYGKFPDNMLDHIDGNVQNNALINLREVSNQINCQNQKRAKCQNKTGFMGVSKMGNKFIARVQGANKEQIYLGAFSTPSEAHEAYLVAKRQLHVGCTI